MTNLYRQFARLFAPDPLLVGEVVEVGNAGILVELPDGARLAARGAATLGSKVFVRTGAIEGVAPDVPVVEIDI
jgi:hypothetical protein